MERKSGSHRPVSGETSALWISCHCKHYFSGLVNIWMMKAKPFLAWYASKIIFHISDPWHKILENVFSKCFLIMGCKHIYKCLSSHKLLWLQVCGHSGLCWRAGWSSGLRIYWHFHCSFCINSGNFSCASMYLEQIIAEVEVPPCFFLGVEISCSLLAEVVALADELLRAM